MPGAHVFEPLLQFSVHAVPPPSAPPLPQSMLHAVEPLQSTVQPPAGHFAAHVLFPPHVSEVPVPIVTLQVLVP